VVLNLNDSLPLSPDYEDALARARKLSGAWAAWCAFVLAVGVLLVAVGNFGGLSAVLIALLVGLPSVAYLRKRSPRLMLLLSSCMLYAVGLYVAVTLVEFALGAWNLFQLLFRVIWISALISSAKRARTLAAELPDSGAQLTADSSAAV
jgi:hypothetical protein